MKKLFFIAIIFTHSLHGMDKYADLSSEDRKNSFVCRGDLVVVAYNEQTKSMYPICGFHQRPNFFLNPTSYVVKLNSYSPDPEYLSTYEPAKHGQLFFVKKDIIMNRPGDGTVSIKSEFTLEDPDLKPFSNKDLCIRCLRQHANGVWYTNIVEKMQYPQGNKIMAGLIVALGIGAYLARQATSY
jgi:hypothetical protein